ncbi:MAG: sigma-70 family RNA polymerase sigma factor [Clostridiales bacterium]|jgi:RNA polymerase sigma-70 factor (ECF subfamily)|nr:sigma-70 family RNA polymerase sigma factor [Clostridiales bacterium]
MRKFTLNAEQKEFATAHHSLIFSFLKWRGLSKNDYYDIIVFGFMQAVYEYLTKPNLRAEYEFSTIAYRNMPDALSANRIYLNRLKRKGVTVSLNDSIPAADTIMDGLERAELLGEIAKQVSRRQMRIILMKANGYGIRYIARKEHVTIPVAKDLLERSKSAVCTAVGGAHCA